MSRIDELLAIMRKLRDPDGGCPWDLRQSFASIVPHTLEEAYEVADAIERGDFADLPDELGDLLFQIVFYAQLGHEQQRFDFDDIVAHIIDKLLRRHPHVFAGAEAGDDTALNQAWEAQKAREREQKAGAGSSGGATALAGVSRALPALTRALKLQRRAARVGFDWSGVDPVLARVDEELEELRVEISGSGSADRQAEELGDLLFSCVNLARHLGIDPETALRNANRKFERRFAGVETVLDARGQNLQSASLDELEQAWQHVKRGEK